MLATTAYGGCCGLIIIFIPWRGTFVLLRFPSVLASLVNDSLNQADGEDQGNPAAGPSKKQKNEDGKSAKPARKTVAPEVKLTAFKSRVAADFGSDAIVLGAATIRCRLCNKAYTGKAYTVRVAHLPALAEWVNFYLA